MRISSLLIPAAMAVALTACDKAGNNEAPTGQVVAKVNGTEITNAELQYEMERLPPNLPNAQDVAIRSIINRYILADVAREQGLDKEPSTAIAQKRAEQIALIDVLTRKLGSDIGKPSDEEVRQYISENPAKFSNRRVYILDQIIINSQDPEIVKALEPLNTLAEITTMLDQRGVEYRKAVGSVDSLTLPADVARRLQSLPADAVFAGVERGSIRVNAIRSVVDQPVPADDAVNIAANELGQRRNNEVMSGKIKQLIDAGLKNVSYNKEFEPKAPADSGTPALPAAAAGQAQNSM